MHYAVPRILAQHSRLSGFATDIVAGEALRNITKCLPNLLLPKAIRRLAARVPTGVPSRQTYSFPAFGFESYLRRRVQRSRSLTAHHLWLAKRFNELVVSADIIKGHACYVFNSAGLEILSHAKSKGMRTFVEQTIAPRSITDRLVQEEWEKYPEWQNAPSQDPYASIFAEREAAEWDRADSIICGSTFVRDALISCGRPPNQCVVVPYGVELPKMARPPRQISGTRLRVLIVGTVELRKGSPYVIEAAQRASRWAEFRIVGSFAANDNVLSRVHDAVDYRGAVPRSAINEHFLWADVFLLPSICEGSATVTYEALAYGVPVICTPNTGSMVQHEIDGFLIPPGDVEAILDRLDRLRARPALLEQMATAARMTRAVISLDGYAKRLIDAIGSKPR
jgi:glycosyltransferase involved in cell wall biosynthesis